MDLLTIADALIADLKPLRFGRLITHVYNPLTYAYEPYQEYVHRYGQRTREVLLVGMNPGPWGMVQTGIPFGEVNVVRDWLRITATVGKPEREHPQRPVLGFACPRSEVSGARLWGWARNRFGVPPRFFAQFFVANYCPLAFFDEAGRNVTPNHLPAQEEVPLLACCDLALRRSVEVLQSRYVIGVGGFAASRARAALSGLNVRVEQILHPSPASPAANRNWAETVESQLAKCGLLIPGATAE